MGAENFFRNNWLLFQNHHQKHKQNTVMSTTQLVGKCSLGTQRDTTNKHGTKTKPRDEKRYSTPMERKQVLNPKYPCQLVIRVLRKNPLDARKSKQKTDLKTSTRRAPQHKFSATGAEAPRSGDSRRFRVFSRRFRIFSRRLRAD
jgi:hypothetical protein